VELNTEECDKGVYIEYGDKVRRNGVNRSSPNIIFEKGKLAAGASKEAEEGNE